MESIDLKKYKNKLLVSDLIFDVLTSKISVSQALSKFPKDKNDINIKCAFDALVHREADEEYRTKIEGYSELQDDLLETIARILKDNQNIPKNIIQNYYKYHKSDIIYQQPKNFIDDIINNVKKRIFFNDKD